MKYCFGVDIGGSNSKDGICLRQQEQFRKNGRLRPIQKKKERQFFRMWQHPLGRKSGTSFSGFGCDWE